MTDIEKECRDNIESALATFLRNKDKPRKPHWIIFGYGIGFFFVLGWMYSDYMNDRPIIIEVFFAAVTFYALVLSCLYLVRYKRWRWLTAVPSTPT